MENTLENLGNCWIMSKKLHEMMIAKTEDSFVFLQRGSLYSDSIWRYRRFVSARRIYVTKERVEAEVRLMEIGGTRGLKTIRG